MLEGGGWGEKVNQDYFYQFINTYEIMYTTSTIEDLPLNSP